MMEPILPSEIVHRKKMGFPTPLKLMFEGKLSEYAHDILLSSRARLHTYFKKDSIEKLIVEHKNRAMDHHRTICQLIVLENWLLQNSGN